MLPEVWVFAQHANLPRKLPLGHMGRQEMPEGLNPFLVLSHPSAQGMSQAPGGSSKPQDAVALACIAGPTLTLSARQTHPGRCTHFGLDLIGDFRWAVFVRR